MQKYMDFVVSKDNINYWQIDERNYSLIYVGNIIYRHLNDAAMRNKKHMLFTKKKSK